jgi:hypothetical protein
VKKPSVASFFKPRSAKVAEQGSNSGKKQQGEAVTEVKGEVKEEADADGKDLAAAPASPVRRDVTSEAIKAEQQQQQQQPQQPDGKHDGAGAAAAVNADERPQNTEAAAAEAKVGEQSASQTTDGSTQQGTPSQKPAASPRKRKAAGSGSAGKGSGLTAKKAKPPGQTDITSFFKK